ncbi:Trehalose-6-P synthase/phosphatase complex subunit, partial [Teratosphaeriaceae sp. CCFEE 6253]
MDERSKAKRWKDLYRTVTIHTGDHWSQQLSETLDQVYDEHSQRASQSVPRLSVQKLADRYKRASKRVFIIDYEGTLAPHRTSNGITLSSPQR